MKLYKYTIIAEYDENKYSKVEDFLCHYPYGERGFEPKELESNTVFSSKEKAIKYAKKNIQEDEESGQLLLIEEIIVDVDDQSASSNITVINLLNNREYECSWFEYNHKDTLYKNGDWVYFYSNQRLQIGMISGEAEGEEPYLITNENNCLSDGHTHDHVGEMWIIKKMDYEEVKKILPYKFLSNIEIRHKLGEIELKERLKK